MKDKFKAVFTILFILAIVVFLGAAESLTTPQLFGATAVLAVMYFLCWKFKTYEVFDEYITE